MFGCVCCGELGLHLSLWSSPWCLCSQDNPITHLSHPTVPPGPPTVVNSMGEQVISTVGPLEEGAHTQLTCKSAEGSPIPTLTWWRDGERLDQVGRWWLSCSYVASYNIAFNLSLFIINGVCHFIYTNDAELCRTKRVVTRISIIIIYCLFFPRKQKCSLKYMIGTRFRGRKRTGR